MKYPELEEPCLSCKLKCFRVEDPRFIKDENCRYRANPIREIKEILGVQEKLKLWSSIINVEKWNLKIER